MMRSLIVLVALAAMLSPLAAQQMWPTTKVWDAGPTGQRIDLVVMGDGYQTNEIPLFHTHVNNFINFWFSRAPYDKYKNMINIWRVDVSSIDSGSDHPSGCYSNPVLVDTELNTTYCVGGTRRCIQPSGPNAQMTALLNVPEYDEILIFVNDPEYGGCAGSIACSTGVHSAASDVAVHELGHSIFNLADEYGGNATYTGGQFSQVNASNQDGPTMMAQGSKWHYWMGQQSISAFEGCRYHDFGAWRPRNNCMMRSLGQTFCAVCQEAGINLCWNVVSEPDSATPALTNNVLPVSPIVVELPYPDGEPMTTEWLVDGIVVGNGIQTPMGPVLECSFDPSTVIGAAPGNHTVSLRVLDPFPMRLAQSAQPVFTPPVWTMSNEIYDLEATDIQLLQGADQKGEVFSIETTITNVAGNTAPSTELLIRVIDGDGIYMPVEVTRVTLPSLAAGATDVQIIPCRMPTAIGLVYSNVVIEVVVDPDGSIQESDEANNVTDVPSISLDFSNTLQNDAGLSNWSVPKLIQFNIDAGPDHAGLPYYLFVSAQAATTPTDLGPFIGTFDFTSDGLTELVAGGSLNALFRDFFGVLDAAGQGQAEFDKPALFGLPPAFLYFNYLTIDSGGSTLIPIVGNLNPVLLLP